MDNIETNGVSTDDEYDPLSPAVFEYSSSNPGNSIRYRMARMALNFNEEQLEQMEEAFLNSPYLTMRAQKNLSRKLCLSQRDIKLWFRNRRIIGDTEWDSDVSMSSCDDDCNMLRHEHGCMLHHCHCPQRSSHQ